MSAPFALLTFVAKPAPTVVTGGFGGGFLDICRDSWSGWRNDRSSPRERKADVEVLVQASPDEVQQQVKEVVQEVAKDRPEVQLQLVSYLNQIPSVARRSLSRRDDPSGRTVPPSMPLTKAEDLAAVLPRLPRFKQIGRAHV